MVNADDFGFTSGVNRAILKAYTDGVVTSATLMANGLAFCEVKELAEQFPKLSIGCHVMLIDGAGSAAGKSSFIDAIGAIS